jgi:hypothetical protein
MFPLNIKIYMILPTTDIKKSNIFVFITTDHSSRGLAPQIYWPILWKTFIRQSRSSASLFKNQIIFFAW